MLIRSFRYSIHICRCSWNFHYFSVINYLFSYLFRACYLETEHCGKLFRQFCFLNYWTTTTIQWSLISLYNCRKKRKRKKNLPDIPEHGIKLYEILNENMKLFSHCLMESKTFHTWHIIMNFYSVEKRTSHCLSFAIIGNVYNLYWNIKILLIRFSTFMLENIIIYIVDWLITLAENHFYRNWLFIVSIYGHVIGSIH